MTELLLFGEKELKTRTTEHISELEKLNPEVVVDRTGFPFKDGVNIYLRSKRENIECSMCEEINNGKTYYYESSYSNTRLIVCNNCKKRECKEAI
uniref:Uncharacterized protein n=1 Tax=viral metagenome TaxID=1070528 RepID=A0A6H1ZS89_9ZZZZ